MITRYNTFNESLKDKFKGKSNDELKHAIFNNSFIIKKEQYCDSIQKDIDKFLDLYDIDINDNIIIDNKSLNADDHIAYVISLIEYYDDIKFHLNDEGDISFKYYIKDKIVHVVDDSGELEFIIFNTDEMKKKLSKNDN